MRTNLLYLVAVCLACAAPSVAQQTSTRPQSATGQPSAQPVAASTVSPLTVEEILKEVRADLQGTRSDIMAKNLTLTSDQAAKFWPVFDRYQKEQNVIIDQQMKLVQTYISSAEAEKLDDAAALSLMKAHLDRDAQMNALRTRYLAEFQKVLPIKLATRAMQIDRRLSLAAQMEMTWVVPLIH